MKCEIDWSISVDAWDTLFAKAPRPSMLQSRTYGGAIAPRMGQRLKYGLGRISGEPVALFQVQEASLLGRRIHALILDRGPVWLNGFGAPEEARAVFSAFDSAFPARFLRRRRVIPEVASPIAHPVFDGLSLTLGRQPGYQTIWVDLRFDGPRLRARLKPKWRNMLAKAEAGGLRIEWDFSGRLLSPFLAHYATDQIGRGYPGPKPDTIRALAQEFGEKTAIAMAWEGDQPAAGILIFLHGRAATWQTGWVGEIGRRTAANHLLLWQAMRKLQEHSVDWLDLGGINPTDAVGVTRFKAGLGGKEVTLAGPFK